MKKANNKTSRMPESKANTKTAQAMIISFCSGFIKTTSMLMYAAFYAYVQAD